MDSSPPTRRRAHHPQDCCKRGRKGVESRICGIIRSVKPGQKKSHTNPQYLHLERGVLALRAPFNLPQYGMRKGDSSLCVSAPMCLLQSILMLGCRWQMPPVQWGVVQALSARFAALGDCVVCVALVNWRVLREGRGMPQHLHSQSQSQLQAQLRAYLTAFFARSIALSAFSLTFSTACLAFPAV